MADNIKKQKVRRRLNFDDVNETQTETQTPKSIEANLNSSNDSAPSLSDDQDFNLLEDSEEEIRKQRQIAREKWNFDFENEVPLNGDWEWERTEPNSEITNRELVSAIDEKKKDENRNV